MQISASNLRRKEYIKFRDGIYQVLFAEFYHPGKGRTVMRTKLRSIATGKAIDQVFSSNDSIESADVQSVPAQFLYNQHDVLVFMDEINYEQYEVPVLLAEDIAGLLKEGQSMYVLLHEGKPIGVIPPKKVVLKVVEADDAVKGDTATNAKKSVKVETGASILVPLFIKTGDTIVINPETGEYTGREN